MTAADNLLFTARLRSPVDIDELEHRLRTLALRHPALPPAGGSAGVPDEAAEISLTCVDASQWGDAELAAIIRLTSHQTRTLADLAIRAVLFTRSAEDHMLLLAVHHTLLSTWGLD